MGVLSNISSPPPMSNRPFGNMGWFVLACYVVLIALAIGLFAGCKDPLLTTTVTQWRDRVVTKRDTVIVTAADSARIKLALEMHAWRKMMAELKANGERTVRGRSHASLTMAVVNDSLVLDAHCDSLEHVLDDALVTIEQRDSTVTVLERAVKDKSTKGVIPGWMQGTAMLLGVIVASLFALLLLYLLIKKHLFKRT